MIHILTLIGLIAGAILGLGIIWTKGIKPIYRVLRKMEQVHDIILEFPEWKARVDTGLEQLYPNHGSSIHDKVMATNSAVTNLAQNVNALKGLVESHVDDQTIHRGITVNNQIVDTGSHRQVRRNARD